MRRAGSERGLISTKDSLSNHRERQERNEGGKLTPAAKRQDGNYEPLGGDSELTAILSKIASAIVYGKVIVDEAGQPIDLLYLDMNQGTREWQLWLLLGAFV